MQTVNTYSLYAFIDKYYDDSIKDRYPAGRYEVCTPKGNYEVFIKGDGTILVESFKAKKNDW